MSLIMLFVLSGLFWVATCIFSLVPACLLSYLCFLCGISGDWVDCTITVISLCIGLANTIFGIVMLTEFWFEIESALATLKTRLGLVRVGVVTISLLAMFTTICLIIEQLTQQRHAMFRERSWPRELYKALLAHDARRTRKYGWQALRFILYVKFFVRGWPDELAASINEAGKIFGRVTEAHWRASAAARSCDDEMNGLYDLLRKIHTDIRRDQFVWRCPRIGEAERLSRQLIKRSAWLIQ